MNEVSSPSVFGGGSHMVEGMIERWQDSFTAVRCISRVRMCAVSNRGALDAKGGGSICPSRREGLDHAGPESGACSPLRSGVAWYSDPPQPSAPAAHELMLRTRYRAQLEHRIAVKLTHRQTSQLIRHFLNLG